MPSNLERVVGYHQRTKHHFNKYAAGPEGLDWASQPDPFRTFEGCAQHELPLLGEKALCLYNDLYSENGVVPQAFSKQNLAALFELSFGISAWKQYAGSRWALRCNPSSGNLHPTEAYLVNEHSPEVENGVYHYVSRDHVLEQRCLFRSHSNGPCLPSGTFLIGLTSIHWREAWKYGERAFRYCQHDVGHAIAALTFAAAALGWRVRALTAWADAHVVTLLGTDRLSDFAAAEREHADLMLIVNTNPATVIEEIQTPERLVQMATEGAWTGKANRLSEQQNNAWPVIDDVADASIKPKSEPRQRAEKSWPAPSFSDCTRSATQIFKQRRSAQEFDGKSGISADAFFRMLDMCLPRVSLPPWSALDWEPRIHLVLFVHRVEGLTPGLYVLPRSDEGETQLRTVLSPNFEWSRVVACPPSLALYRLVGGDGQRAAQTLSCHQAIAAEGAFSLGMLAEFEGRLIDSPWVYRQLFWEAGILGQVLYLEAEAAGVRGTGIGCYFDDAVHDLLGLKDPVFQSLYHFTVGKALTDARLQTLPGYAHLTR